MSPFHRRLGAWVALLAFSAFFGLGWTSASHLGGDDDTACGQVSLSTGHAHVQFERVKLAATPTHCPFCHWQQTIRSARLASAAAALPVRAGQRVLPPDSHRAHSTDLEQRRSRGPPSAFVLA
jgi:hypothetical protein